MATAFLNRLSQALTTARTLTRDARAIQTGRYGQRISNRIRGRLLARVTSRLWRRP